ncbi:nitroreductase [Heliobacillus mobilis]|uniref:Nitroreductase n=1 Tax=Heliobacterium mobile TaxID=28064 RepID=A0A6I3SSB8_HELMO|nr:nitroreductase family protein [Heliobacterium mobile]MTV50937.1 nitroreductase [Heliobacterium mobile]
MDIPVKRWFDAIPQRRSRRNYTGQTLPPHIRQQISEFIESWNGIVGGARIVFVPQNPDKVFKGAVGSYGKIKNAPAYAAFIGDMSHPNVQENTGYLGEGFILEMTALGMATCWVGGMFDPKVVEEHIRLEATEKVLSVTPIGYATKDYSFQEKLMAGLASGQKRKELEDLCLTPGTGTCPPWVKSALKAAQLSPSAVNRQPWRFSVEDQAIQISVDNGKDTYHIAKRLDCGIAMLHLEVGAMFKGMKGSWKSVKSPDVARFEVMP